MRLKARVSANNEIRISLQSDPIIPKNYSDNASRRRQNKLDNLDAEIESLGQEIAKYAPLEDFTDNGLNKLVSLYAENSYSYDSETGEYDIIKVKTRLGDLIDEYRKLYFLRHNLSVESKSKLRSWGISQHPKKFSKLARHTLLEAGCVVDRVCNLDNCYSLTLTIPGSTKESFKVISEWSGYIIDKQKKVINSYLRYHNRNKSDEDKIEIYHFFVWEFQSRGALHQHWLIASNYPDVAEYLAHRIKDKWYSILKEFKQSLGVDCFATGDKSFSRPSSWVNSPDKWQWRVTQIEKSVGAYYSKYVGKEINNLSVKDKDYVYFPSRWWGCSQSIRKLIYDCRSDFVMSNLDSDLAGAYYQCILDDLPMDAIVKKYYYDYNIYNSDTGQLLGSGHELIIYFPSDLWQSSLNNFLKERFDFYRYCNILVERARLEFKRVNEVPKVFRGSLDGVVRSTLVRSELS